ncbi:helix-turn-helix domain-containing protein [Celeribacter sp. ULVN23_4]
MTQIDPTRFWPREAGASTLVTLPGRASSPRIDVLCVSPGLTVALSWFANDQSHCDEIRRPTDQVLLAFNLSGAMRLEPVGENESYEITRGQGWIIRPGATAIKRIVEKGAGCSNLVFSLRLPSLPATLREALVAALPQPGMLRHLKLSVPLQVSPETLFDGLSSPAALIRKEGLCLSLIGHALEDIDTDEHTKASDPRRLVTRARLLMTERMGESISLEMLTGRLGVSHVTLTRAFRQVCGTTVFEDLRRMRILKAEHLIKTTALSLTQIAYECGFSSPAHLSTAFRKSNGLSPTQWRARL